MGKVYLVGAGPGDPELITVKGLRCIRRADVILYDRLINPELLEEGRVGADLVYCGKLPHHHALHQETINRFLIKFARRGKTVTRLKGGDPFLFGRGGEEAEALARHWIDFEVVPGITAGLGATAYAGIPVTHRAFGASVAFVAGHRRSGEADDIRWANLAQGVDTLVIYMGVGNLRHICEQLVKGGRSGRTPAAAVQWGTTEEQHTVTGTLSDIAERAKRNHVQSPAVIVVGEVVRLRGAIRWFDIVKSGNAAAVGNAGAAGDTGTAAATRTAGIAGVL